ncbi:hypothetical protein AQI95_17135 [Streptomyces yokosukanensis]|uniref:DUF4232 domain-containing protein n=1 Tax=Streptomyces yokosukanensis TaxID=67386 RepID=A0A117Q2Q9_9ACTN|nr:DUF4232 domain-containing protein [Streptomyces yokosukanensis]KUN05201.1 hypothetical protein AQI95_17135 [Streptomyces yokosukanensis]
MTRRTAKARKAAVLVLGLAVLAGLAACGSGHGDSDSRGRARAAACGSPQLRWKWTPTADRRPGAPAAQLSATNKRSQPCTLDGYPQVKVWVGKAQDVYSEPRKNAKPVRLVLDPGRTVDFPLFYEAQDVPRGSCWIAGDYDASSDVVPPHPAKRDYGSFVHPTDAKGHRLPTQVCSDTIRLDPPRLR